VEGPSEAKLVCKDNKDGTCSATYVPEEPGEYDVHVKYADEHVPGSPFKVKATRPVDASKVKCFGPGVDKAPLFESAPTHFTVDTAEAGDAPLDVVIETPDKKKIKPDEIKKVDDNTYEVQYTPPKEGENVESCRAVTGISKHFFLSRSGNEVPAINQL
jgi:filamin